MSNFQERFGELLQRTGIDASTLAANLGVSKQTISAWKTGARSPKKPVLKVIAEYFDVSLPWLCGLDVPIGSYSDQETEDMRSIPQIAIMGRGMEQLTPEQRTLVVDMMRPLFKSYFNVDLPTEDNV